MLILTRDIDTVGNEMSNVKFKLRNIQDLSLRLKPFMRYFLVFKHLKRNTKLVEVDFK